MDKTDKELAKSMRPKKKKKAKKSKGKNVPTNPELYSRVKSEAKKKFDVYPSAYANAWLVKTYKKRGGTYTTKKA